MNKYIITQNKRYFSKHKHSQTLNIASMPKAFLNALKNEPQSIKIFLYDHDKKKIFGKYSLENNSVLKKKSSGLDTIEIGLTSFRRGIFYSDEKSYKDNSIYKIDSATYHSIYEKLQINSCVLRHSILSTSFKNNKFYIKYIDISKDFFIAESETIIDIKAFDLLVGKYHSLINRAKSEMHNIEDFRILGRAFMNMFLPDDDFNSIFFRGTQIVYLECDNRSLVIPWTIFVYNDIFLSSRIIFSYLHQKNHFYPSQQNISKRHRTDREQRMAIIVIENEDLVLATREARFIADRFACKEHVSIDIYNKRLDYLEFINICENYDILHIITHGNAEGLVLSDDYILTHQSIKSICRAPSFVFLSTCYTSHEHIYSNQNIISSFLSSGVQTIIASIGRLADDSEYRFIEHFYQHYLHQHSNISSAIAYNFAIRSLASSSIRHLFFGIPIVNL